MSSPSLAILCVDDERIVISSLREQLRRSFGERILIETAESGEEGLEVLDELAEEGEALALVISDQLMPGMRGEAFLAEVHQRDPRVFTVLLTGQASADAVGEAVNKARLYRYIGKPWVEHDLVLTVRGALRSYRQAREIERQEAEAQRAHEASLRFVPQEFLSVLGRDRLVDLQHGDHAERPMHILLSDMRGYTSLVESKPPDQAFSFVNDYFQRMEQPVHTHGGFVADLVGDAVLALFPRSADDAVAAALDSFAALERMNQERAARGEPPVEMGLGINSGPLLLGTVGGTGRLQCAVVGDPVNTASRIESLTKRYGARMLISGESLEQLDDPPALRRVDRVRVKGKEQPVTVYEVLDVLPAEIQERRLATRERFEAAGEAFRAGRFPQALAGFAAVIAEDPADLAAALFVGRSQELMRHGRPKGWDGTVRLTRK